MWNSSWRSRKQVEHLGLHRDVERGGRLVGDAAGRGLHDTAPAISTRCAMPPETWCGYAAKRALGVGIPHAASRSSARCLASALPIPSATRIGSVSWLPMVKAGSRLDIGSWGM
jgi:hypothetical protein